MFPITMPYYPRDRFKVCCEDLLTDSANGDFDTLGIMSMTKPDGTSVNIFRYFKDGPGDWIEIDAKEYRERKRLHMKREYDLLRGKED